MSPGVCAPGYEYVRSSETCEFCSVGSYQRETGALMCDECEDPETTINAGATSATECQGKRA